MGRDRSGLTRFGNHPDPFRIPKTRRKSLRNRRNHIRNRPLPQDILNPLQPNPDSRAFTGFPQGCPRIVPQEILMLHC